MKQINRFIKNESQEITNFGNLVILDVWYDKKPTLYLLQNESDEKYLYCEFAPFSYKNIYIISIPSNILKKFKEGDCTFNEMKNKELIRSWRINIYNTHNEVFEMDESSSINTLHLYSNDYYITTYRDLVLDYKNRLFFRKSKKLLVLSEFLLILAVFSLFIPNEIISIFLAVLFSIPAIFLMYLVFYNFRKHTNLSSK